MDALSRFSIRTRLYFGMVFSLVLLIVIGGMGYFALDQTRGTLHVLFSERVQTLTDMSELRTTLGDLRRTEKDIIINFNNAVEVASLRESWGKTLVKTAALGLAYSMVLALGLVGAAALTALT